VSVSLGMMLSPTFHTLRVQFIKDPDRLRANYAFLRTLASGKPLLPMVKGSGYGHGAGWVAKTLSRVPGIYGFGVASHSEAIQVRDEYKGLKPVYLFSNSYQGLPTEEALAFFLRYNIRPVLTTARDAVRLLSAVKDSRARSRIRKIKFHIKWDTGMHRSGIPFDEVKSLLSLLCEAKGSIEGHATHLACADQIEHPTTVIQMSRYRELTHVLRLANPEAHFHFGASAVLAQSSQYEKLGASDLYRPGISLYGVDPSPELVLKKLKLVGNVQIRVLAVKKLNVGETVGYGALYKNVSGAPEKIAVLGAGYADGILRLSGTEQGYVCVKKIRRPIVGRISMDMCTIRGEGLRAGELVEWYGDRTDVWHLARALGTIPYELMTAFRGRMLDASTGLDHKPS